jgi:hypothetical protein
MQTELELAELRARVDDALALANNIDGDHHKQWTIDGMVRALTGDGYDAWVQAWEHCGNEKCDYHNDVDNTVDCDQGYSWDEGIAP